MTAIRMAKYRDNQLGWEIALHHAMNLYRTTHHKYRVTRRLVKGRYWWCVYTSGDIKDKR